MLQRRLGAPAILSVLLLATANLAKAQELPLYKCPGNPIEYTNRYSAAEAAAKGCKTIEGAPVTIVQTPARRAAPTTAAASPSGAPRVDPNEQRARDSDKRQILEGELRREENRLAELRKEYNNGEPERQGNERNYQKYLDRVASLKGSIARSEADISALRRELGNLPAP
jgi:hypothetical protein